MDGHAWVTAFAERAGIAPLDESDIEALLDLASVAAHSSERFAAPLTCFLVGRAGLSIADARAIADSLAAG